MPIEVSSLADLARALLAAVVDYYADVSVPVEAALPDRQYVSDGLPAYDMAQLTVHLVRTFSLDDTGNESANFPVGPLVRRAAAFGITLLRDSPVMDQEGIADVRIPTVDEIETSAELVMADSERLADALVVGYHDGALPNCSGLFFAGWTAYGPEGGLVGGVAEVRALLD